MIAFVPIARTTFDIPFAKEQADLARAAVRRTGLEIVEIADLLTDLDAVRGAIGALAGAPLDLVVVLQATFADSTMVTVLAEAIDAPLLLWALPEPQVGGRLRLNSLCGVNLAAFALKRRGKVYDYVYAAPGDDAVQATIMSMAGAGRALRALRGARIGVIGQHPDGFEPCAYDADRLRAALGVEVMPYDLDSIFGQADAIPSERVEAQYARVAAQLANLGELNPVSVRGTLSFHEAMHDVVTADGLQGAAVRCWPETFLKRDCAVCAASSMLSEAGIPASCEADVNGTVTGLILQTISSQPAFSADLVAADIAAQTVVFWHCGLAPLSMCDPDFQPRGALHSNRQRPLLMEFPLKPGRATVARLTQAGADGGYRLAIGRGEMLAAPMQFTGTSGVFRFDSPLEAVLDTIMREGLDHHYTIAYGDHAEALRQFAAMAGLPVILL